MAVSEGDTADGLWVTVAELAKMRGIARQVMYRKVDRLAGLGRIELRSGPRGAKVVNVAAFDAEVGEVTDLARQQGAMTRRAAAAPSAPPIGTDPVYTQEQARKMAYSADREKIALGEDLDRLVPVDRLDVEFARVLGPVARALTRLSTRADALLDAVTENGRAGARTFLDDLGAEISNMIAAAAGEVLASISVDDPRTLDDFDPRAKPLLSLGALVHP